MQPLHWVLLGVGGAILAFCGLCGVVGVIGSFGDDPAPKVSVVAATPATAASPTAVSPTEASPAVASPTVASPTGAPLVGDRAPVAETSTEVDVVEPEPARTTRRAVPAAPSTRRADPPPTTADATYYKNCDAVRDAGAAPIHVGEPGYAKHLDRDGDGIGCEN